MPHRSNAELVAMPVPDGSRAAEILAISTPGTPLYLRCVRSDDTLGFAGDFAQVVIEDPRKNGLKQTIWVPTALLTPRTPEPTTPTLSVIDGGKA